MANLQDYVRWRGDLVFADHAFNIVDNLVLSALANIDLTDIVPGPDHPAVTVESAAEAMLAQESRGHSSRRLVFVPPSLLTDLARSARFANAEMSDYVDLTDDATGVQFSAVTVALDDGSSYVAFRGTDTSIVGWREDFTMSFEQMPSQPLAVDYLQRVIGGRSGAIRVGGHSKGGNLAVYAAMMQGPAERGRVTVLYSNDGPGLSPQVADQVSLAELRQRTVKIVPEFAIIGRLFDSEVTSHIVASSVKGVAQHDIMTWQVEGTGLVERPVESPRAALVNGIVDAWLEDAGEADRRDFTTAFFGALSAGGATLVQDIPRAGFGSFESVLFSLVRSRSKTRRSYQAGVRVIKRSLTTVDYRALLRRRQSIRATTLALIGILLVVVPELAVQVLGSFAALLLSALVTIRLVRYYARYRRLHRVRWWWVAGGVILLILLLFGLSHIAILVGPANLLLGVGLVAQAISSAGRGLPLLHRQPQRRVRGSLFVTSAVVSLLMGIVAFSTFYRVQVSFVLAVGLYFFAAGAIDLFFIFTDRIRQAYVLQSASEELRTLR